MRPRGMTPLDPQEQKAEEGRVQPATPLTSDFFERSRSGSWEMTSECQSSRPTLASDAVLRTHRSLAADRRQAEAIKRPSFCLCVGPAKPAGVGFP